MIETFDKYSAYTFWLTLGILAINILAIIKAWKDSNAHENSRTPHQPEKK